MKDKKGIILIILGFVLYTLSYLFGDILSYENHRLTGPLAFLLLYLGSFSIIFGFLVNKKMKIWLKTVLSLVISFILGFIVWFLMWGLYNGWRI